MVISETMRLENIINSIIIQFHIILSYKQEQAVQLVRYENPGTVRKRAASFSAVELWVDSGISIEAKEVH